MYLEEMKDIQVKTLDFLENDDTMEEENFYNLKLLIIEQIQQDQHKFKTFLYMLSSISKHHHHELKFYEKIDKILDNFKEDIKKYYSNSEIFNIFKGNKRILLFLLENQIITMDEYIARKILDYKNRSRKYPQYFWPEIQQFKNEKWFIHKLSDLSDFFDEINQLIF